MPGLYQIKPQFVAALSRLEDAAVRSGISADTLTFASLPVAVLTAGALAAGAFVHPLWWLAVGPLALVRMALNALDGAVARRTGTSHPAGEVYNELVDRGADAITFAAVAFVAPAWLAAAAVAAAFATSLVAVLAQALTGQRAYGGPMGKPDRVLTLSAAATVAVVVGPVAFSWGLGAIVTGCLATAALRTRALLRTVHGRSVRA